MLGDPADAIQQVIQPFGLQTAQNILALLTSFFAIFLYFSTDTPCCDKIVTALTSNLDIGMKTVYLEVFQEIFNFPAITTKKGQWCWYALGPVYWILAFVVAAAVPNLSKSLTNSQFQGTLQWLTRDTYQMALSTWLADFSA